MAPQQNVVGSSQEQGGGAVNGGVKGVGLSSGSVAASESAGSQGEHRMESGGQKQKKDGAESNLESTQPPQRNYASKECGAKVLLAHDEAENRAAILSGQCSYLYFHFCYFIFHKQGISLFSIKQR